MAYESWFTGRTVDKGLVHNITISGSAGSWTGTIGNGIGDEGAASSFSIFDGLKVEFKITIAGGSSTTYFNLNGKGNKIVYYK